jgi:putative transposase
MRKSRKITLNGSGIFHKTWRGHNREYVLDDAMEKHDYLSRLGAAISAETTQKVKWHSFCLMGNHTHETGSVAYDKNEGNFISGIAELGNWMRRGHAAFGAAYNARHNRQGKVAYDRPATREVEDDTHLLKVMFYGDANPVRAGMVSHPSKYHFSTWHFYAYGKKSRYTKYLTPPKAYLSLGKTAKERQKKYRSLCDAYLREAGLIEDQGTNEMESPFIGSTTWCASRCQQIKKEWAAIREGP